MVSWDEAWYAEIARNIVQSGDLLNLSWSGQPYFDHPPAGFWLIALAFKLFGVSEFTARLMPALAGLFSVLLIYLLGKELFGWVVGFASAIALPSSFWFLFRARSGNLDSFLVFFFLLTIFLAIKASQDKRFLVPFSVSLSFLFLTKTLVPFAILPVLAIIFWRATPFKPQDLVLPAVIFVILVGSWLAVQLEHEGFVSRYFQVGLNAVDVQADLLAGVKNVKRLTHEGVGHWFWPGALAIFAGLIFRQKRFLLLSIFFVVFATAFAYSAKTGIWHLIPLHPILILSLFGFSWVAGEKIVATLMPKIDTRLLVAIPILALSAYVSFIQLKRSWYWFIDIPAFTSDEEILSREAAKYPQELLIAGSDFRPAPVFYSGKDVPQMILGIRLQELFASDRTFLMIAPQSELKNQGVFEGSYTVLKKDRDKVLVLKE